MPQVETMQCNFLCSYFLRGLSLRCSLAAYLRVQRASHGDSACPWRSRRRAAASSLSSRMMMINNKAALILSTSMRQSSVSSTSSGISLIAAFRSSARNERRGKHRCLIIEANDREFRMLNSGPDKYYLGTESFHLAIGLWSTPAHGFSLRTCLDSAEEEAS